MVENQSKLLPPSAWLKRNYTEEVTAISKGNFGEVYSFIDPKDSVKKALKVIKKKADEDEKEWMFESKREIQILDKLNDCPHSIKLFEYHMEFETSRILLIMELADQSLYDYIKIDRKKQRIEQPLNEGDLHKLLKCLAGGLEYALNLNINHRDIKPENVLIMKDGSFKLADWGAGTIFNKAGTRTVTGIIGTPGFTAPEVIEIGLQLENEITDKELLNLKLNWEKADIYSCGVLLMETCGIYRDQLEKIKLKHGLENGLNVLLNDKLANGPRSYMIQTILNMCKLSTENRWGIKEFKNMVKERLDNEELIVIKKKEIEKEMQVERKEKEINKEKLIEKNKKDNEIGKMGKCDEYTLIQVKS